MALGSSCVDQLCKIQALGQYSWRNASGNIFAEQHWGQDSFGQLSGSVSRQLGESPMEFSAAFLGRGFR
jgi:hypothetical protein